MDSTNGGACQFIHVKTLTLRLTGRNNQREIYFWKILLLLTCGICLSQKKLKRQEALATFLGKRGCLPMTLTELLFQIACPCPLSLVRYSIIIKGGGAA